MISLGIIMAGGQGSRLKPITNGVNKHLLPIYDKPMIYYPISTLMLMGIRKILIIVNKQDLASYKNLLGDGKKFGIKINFIIQKKSIGIPDAFRLCARKIYNKKFALILGDNFFFGQGLSEILNNVKNFNSGAAIFLKEVSKPQDFGIAVLKKNKITKIVEKPKKFISSQAITGLYLFDTNCLGISKKLKFSKRNELEITDVLNQYLNKKELIFYKLGRGTIWEDCGSIKSLQYLNNLVKNLEENGAFKIACLEEIALNKKYITPKNLAYLDLKIQSDYLKYINKIKKYNKKNENN
jgi:glucose-1-phosphate thymidylyltransferase